MADLEREPPLFEQAAAQAVLVFSPEPPRGRPMWDRYRAAGNRSFPSGYPVPSELMMQGCDFTEIEAWEQSVRRELGMDGGIFRGVRRRARIATNADRRAMVGPSDEDIAALGGEILHGWCLAKSACQRLGIASHDPLARNPNVRYGLVLDYLARDIAKQLYVLRGHGADGDAARERFGLDVVRISIEHGVTPDALAPYLSRLGATFE